jgi:FMN-dependent NADH-azoreductase
MKLLHLDSSALGDQSVTRELGAAIIAHWRARFPGATVEYRDLDANPVPHLSGRSLARTDPALAAQDDQVLEQFLEADVIVVGAPMYNFGIPSTLKAWIDRIAIKGKTFRYTEQGPEGLAAGKRVIVASGRGGAYGDSSPADFQEAYLRQLFGFLGIGDIQFVRAEGVGLSPQHREQALATAKTSLLAPLRDAA